MQGSCEVNRASSRRKTEKDRERQGKSGGRLEKDWRTWPKLISQAFLTQNGPLMGCPFSAGVFGDSLPVAQFTGAAGEQSHCEMHRVSASPSQVSILRLMGGSLLLTSPPMVMAGVQSSWTAPWCGPQRTFSTYG